MLLDGGRWQGRQIVPAAYVHDSLQGGQPAEPDWRFGFQSRMGTLNVAGRNWPWAAAFGNGGQRLYLVPALDLAVVITAGRCNRPQPENSRPSEVLFRRVVDTLASVALR